MPEAKSSIDIEKMTVEERAALSRSLAELSQNLPNAETVVREAKPKLEDSEGNQEESFKADASPLSDTKAVPKAEEDNVIDVAKGKKGVSILNNFFETGDFESIPNIQENAANVMDEVMGQKKE